MFKDAYHDIYKIYNNHLEIKLTFNLILDTKAFIEQTVQHDRDTFRKTKTHSTHTKEIKSQEKYSNFTKHNIDKQANNVYKQTSPTKYS